jgi:UDP-3-O-[3-hydroxymyristoyl] N-acetylglucosamine deacetylase
VSIEKTLAESVSFEGVGLHSGEATGCEVGPAPPGTGIVFEVGGPTPTRIPARAQYVSSTRNATTLARGGAAVATVEHLLAALSGLGVDNARVVMAGPELPILDGSARPFVEAILAVGLEAEGRPRRWRKLLREICVEDGDRRIRLLPADALSIHYVADFPHPCVGRQSIRFDTFSPALFAAEVAPARTFGFAHEIEALQAAGLGRGGSLENTVVFDAEGVRNPGGLRFPDEVVRHKVLDLVGDLALLGAPLCARIEVLKGGHALHRAAVDALLGDPDACPFESAV